MASAANQPTESGPDASKSHVDAIAEQVKRTCAITWDSEETNAKVDRMVRNAIIDIRGKVGIPSKVEIDLSVPGRENELIVMRCFYDWNNALDEFEDNYLGSIMAARQYWEVMANAAQAEEAPSCLS